MSLAWTQRVVYYDDTRGVMAIYACLQSSSGQYRDMANIYTRAPDTPLDEQLLFDAYRQNGIYDVEPIVSVDQTRCHGEPMPRHWVTN